MYRLLVADDEIIERKVLLKTLQKNLEGQCELFQAENGREALEIYEKEKIQIAILDIEMPGINGIQAAEKIREKDKNCCIIFLTAYDEFSYAKRLSPVRALDYILKPWDVVKFVIGSREDLNRAKEIIERFRLCEKAIVYFSPVFGKIEPEEIVEFMKENKLNKVRFQIQIHKVVWDPDKTGV